jgi:hypothetical protein
MFSIRLHVMKTSATTPSRALANVPRGRFVRVADLPGTLAAKSSAVCRAHKAGDLVAIRKGLYFKGVKTRYGMTTPTDEEIATEVLGTTGVGPTGYSAARALGLTTQVPSEPALTIAGPTPTSLPGVKISRRNNMRRRDLNYTEIAVLELLRGDWETTIDGGWPALVTAYRTGIETGDIRPRALRAAIATERSPRARRNFDLLTADA